MTILTWQKVIDTNLWGLQTSRHLQEPTFKAVLGQVRGLYQPYRHPVLLPQVRCIGARKMRGVSEKQQIWAQIVLRA